MPQKIPKSEPTTRRYCAGLIVLLASCSYAQIVINPSGGGGSSTPTANTISTALYCADAGASDTYACSLPAAPTYSAGFCAEFKANTANTGAATINFNSVGAQTIVKVAGGVTTTLANNDIRAGQVALVCYDGTNFQLQSTLGNAPSGTGDLLAANNLSDVANAATSVNNLGGASSTGTGGLVRTTSPTLVTPVLGVAAGTSLDLSGILTTENGVNYCLDAVGTDSYACSLSPAITAYVTGACYTFKAATINTGAASINFNAIGAKTIAKVVNGVTTTLSDNDIHVGSVVNVCYDGTNMQMQSTLGSGRVRLNADLTLYVRTDGNDSNTCLGDTAGTACLTVQAAWDKIANNYDGNYHQVTLTIRAGTFGDLNVEIAPLGFTDVTIDGAGATTILTDLQVDVIEPAVTVSNLKIDNTSGSNIAVVGGEVRIDTVELGALTTGNHISVSNGGVATVTGLTISGGATRGFYVFDGGRIQMEGEVTLTGTPDFGSAFAVAYDGGAIDMNGQTFTGSATGGRFIVDTGGRISTEDASLTYLPGDQAGEIGDFGGSYDAYTSIHQLVTPTVSSCGTTPSTVTGHDLSGRLTTGSGGTVQSCTLTFGIEFAVAPSCVVNNQTTILLVRATATTTTLVLDSAVAGTLESEVLNYVCQP